ncbi:hypothetical protein ACMX25_14380 [Caballeronia sp. 15715]|uniref:hypothetical protein n=1 Tax=Caballeronia sp. 15715 TaxID=3391030 RepID=UPI0039E6CD90
MTTAPDLASGAHDDSPESLLTFAKYFERSLDEGMSIVMRRESDIVSILMGEAAGEWNDLKNCGTITTALADEILALTKSGANQITVGELQYRFFRSFTHIEGAGAVVFAPA